MLTVLLYLDFAFTLNYRADKTIVSIIEPKRMFKFKLQCQCVRPFSMSELYVCHARKDVHVLVLAHIYIQYICSVHKDLLRAKPTHRSQISSSHTLK